MASGDDAALAAAADAWDRAGSTARLFDRDASLWTGGDEARWLGWLDLDDPSGRLASWREVTTAVLATRPSHVLLAGMGGSSLAPDLWARTFAPRDGHPALRVLDSTVPGQVLAAERGVDLARTVVVVASKSGSTLEPNLFKDRLIASLGSAGVAKPESRCIAITDPGSSLEAEARERGWGAVVHGRPDVGGRFSALSAFGLLPALLMGVDVAALLDGARAVRERCRLEPAASNPGVALGLALGTHARAGRDKLTLVLSPGIAGLGAWIEQLVAESTGKRGVAVLPFDGERLAAPARYGADRVFAHVALAGEAGAGPTEDALAALERAGHPVLRARLGGLGELGGEMFRWEVATAVAGSVLGIHPFDQPDVEASKVAARELMDRFEREGRLDEAPEIACGDGFRVHAHGEAHAGSVREALAAHLARVRPGDYVATLAFVEQSPATEPPLQELRHAVRDALGCATSLGFGPRFLHSTGQAFAGGPPSGVFLQVTADDAEDVPIPGRRSTFATVKDAQAGGSFRVLADRGRRALRVHVKGPLVDGLERLARLVGEAASQTAARAGEGRA